MIATYVNTTQFTVVDDHTSEFLEGRRVKVDCGVDGYKYSTIQTSSYSSPNTTVTIDEGVLTSNLSSVLYGIVSMGDTGSLPYHRHDATEGHGGRILFSDLEETPSTYSGTSGKYAQSTGSGIIWAPVSTAGGSSDVTLLTDLTDTPSTYSGTEGKYAQSTGSGIVFEEIQTDKSFLDLTDTPTTWPEQPEFISEYNEQIEIFSVTGSTLWEAPKIKGGLEILIVGGGGSGGGSNVGGGGGAGGLIHKTDISVVEGQSYSIIVGAGGAESSSIGNDGEDSSGFGYTAKGGGGGGGGGWMSTQMGRDGGSGSGANGANNGTSCIIGEAIDSNYGNNGGACYGGATTAERSGGGGGGAGSVGQDATLGNGGDGGEGIQIDITGSDVWYAAGGGGATNNSSGHGIGGSGIGGDGSDSGHLTSGSGVDGTGSGGGARCEDGPSLAGAGGSGIVILKYLEETLVINEEAYVDYCLAVNDDRNGVEFKVYQQKSNFNELNDTPITYSGTTGKYAQSTGSGIIWAPVSTAGGSSDVTILTDLTDTPSTYSGTSGKYLQSTGSGVVWASMPDPQIPIIKDLFDSFNTDIWELSGDASYDSTNNLVILVPNETDSNGKLIYKPGVTAENFTIIINGEASGGIADYHRVTLFGDVGEVTGGLLEVEIDSYNKEFSIEYAGIGQQEVVSLPTQLQEKFTLEINIQTNILTATLYTDNYYRVVEKDISDISRDKYGLYFTGKTGGEKSLRTVTSISIYEDKGLAEFINDIPNSILDFTDTPNNYSDGMVLHSTASGTEWATVSAGGGITSWNFGDNTISGTGDIYCNDIYTSSGTVYIGDLQLSTNDGEHLLVNGEEITSTASGIETFIDLTDTPTTYPVYGEEGTYNLIIDSTKIDEDLTDFPIMINLENYPDLFDTLVSGTDYKKLTVKDSNDDYCYTEVECIDYENKTGILWSKIPSVSSSVDTEISIGVEAVEVTAKSVIIDIADNWGASDYIALCSVDFYKNGVLIEKTESDFTAYHSSCVDVNDYHAKCAFDTSLAKTGSWRDTQYVSGSSAITNQRIICVFDATIDFNKVVINNAHDTGTRTNSGSKNIKINISSDSITDTTYNAAISNSTEIFDGQLDQHVASDVVDDQILTLTNIYSGYTDITGTSIAQNVWDSNFVAVYHMAQDPSGGTDCILDSTSNENHGTPAGTMTSDDLVDADYGKAIDFDGTDDYINIPDHDDFDFVVGGTLEAVVKANDVFVPSHQDYHQILTKGGTYYTTGYSLNIYERYSSSDVRFGSVFNADGYANIILPSNDWTDLTFVASTVVALETPKLFLNSVKYTSFVSSGENTSFPTDSNNLLIAASPYSHSDNLKWKGEISEVRISDVARSDAWIKATYNSNTDNLLSEPTSFGTLYLSINDTNDALIFREFPTIPATFIDLTDTPSTYSGTSGKFAQSTGSGIVWTTVSGGSGGTTDHSALDNLDYASSGHTGFQPAGDYVTETEFSTYSGTLQSDIDGKSDSSHLHDDRYYTESEIDALLLTISGGGSSGASTFVELTDTPSTYSGTEGKYAQSTGSGIVFEEIQTDKSFLDLTDTPNTYDTGQYLRTTASGVGSIDGIILKAENNSEWMIKVTNSGILYTEAM